MCEKTEVFELILNLCRFHVCQQMQRWDCTTGYLWVCGRDTRSTEWQTFRFHFEILDTGKMFVSFTTLSPDSTAGMGKGAERQSCIPSRCRSFNHRPGDRVHMCPPEQSRNPTIRSPHMAAAWFLRNTSLSGLLDKVEVLRGCKVSDMTISYVMLLCFGFV